MSLKKWIIYMLAIMEIIFGLGVIFLLVLWGRAIAFKPKPMPKVAVPPSIEIDEIAVAQHLSQAVQIQTFVPLEPEKSAAEALLAFRKFIETTYPLIQTRLERTFIAEYSLLYKWQGTDASLKPMLLMAHQDVVRVDDASTWTQPPFSGRIAEGYVWGRGTVDLKGSLIGILEAVEMLLKEGFVPRRTVYLAFGHDEETSGSGAQATANYLKNLGVQFEYVNDEGGAIVEGAIPGIHEPVAVIGTAEKGALNLELIYKGEGGHSAFSSYESAIDVLMKALFTLKKELRFATHLDKNSLQTLAFTGPHMTYPLKLIVANLWLFKPWLVYKFKKDPLAATLISTIFAATLFQAGMQVNILPVEGRVIVNFRISANQSVAEIEEQVKKIINDPRIHIKRYGFVAEATPVSSPIDNYGFKTLVYTIKQLMRNKKIVLAPSRTIGSTDSRFYRTLANGVYNFMAIEGDRETFKGMHGIDECLSIKNLLNIVRFNYLLIKNSQANTVPGENLR